MVQEVKKYVTVPEGTDFKSTAGSLAKSGFPVKSAIYLIRSKKTNRVYFGSAVDYKRRWREHKKLLLNGKHPNAFLLYSFQNRSTNNIMPFLFEVKEFIFAPEILLHREQYYLDQFYDKQDMCYNLAPKAGSAHGVRWSAESKLIHSQNRLGSKNPMWGKKHNLQTRLLMSNRQNKQVEQRDVNGKVLAVHKSISAAAKTVGVSRQMIGHCCNLYRKTSKGFIWRFTNGTKK